MKWINYRPVKLINFIGQEEIKFNLKIYINSVIINKTHLDHILLSGPSGIGKTTLASILANELGYKIIYAQGSHLSKLSDILNLFSLVTDNQIIFIDEFHMIDKSIIENLYTILEDFVIDIPIGVSNNSKMTRMKLPNFTLIAATNYLWKLPNPLVDRFPIKLFLSNYTEDDIFNIINQLCNINKFSCNNEDLKYIASISRNNPRIANNLLKRYFDYISCFENIENYNIKHIFQKIGIYPKGLTSIDIQYLNLINNATNLSLQAISQNLLIDKNTIELTIEQYLIKIGFVKINSKGRSITKIGKDYLLHLI